MAAKVNRVNGAWWIVIHHNGKKRRKRIGPTNSDKRTATAVAQRINAQIALGDFNPLQLPKEHHSLDVLLTEWLSLQSPTFKKSYEITARGLIYNHLIPHFGDLDIRELTRDHILAFIRDKTEQGRAPATIQNALSTLRTVLNIAVDDGKLAKNPASGIGKLMSRVRASRASGVHEAEPWHDEEVETLLQVASEHAPRLYPALATLLLTGIRRGELLALQWDSVDFEQHELAITRAWVRSEVTTPKTGKSRRVLMPPMLAELLLDVLGERRRECLANGWKQVPLPVFCSTNGSHWNERNFNRSWESVRRRAHVLGVRPLKLHSARHTYASRALAGGKSILWVARQLGHSNPEHTLRRYTHLMPSLDEDLSFAEVGVPIRPDTALSHDPRSLNRNAADVSSRRRLEFLDREPGFEPATLSLGSRGLARRC